MAAEPAFPLATGPLPLSRFEEPLLIDPDPNCLWMLVTAWAESVPRVADPPLDQLRQRPTNAVTQGRPGSEPPRSRSEAPRSGSEAPRSGSEHPVTTILATTNVFETVTTRFTDASLLAALVDTGRLHLCVLERPQPNTVLTGPGDDVVLVASDGGYHAVCVSDQHFPAPERDVNPPKRLFETYDPLATTAPPYRVSVPSRHRLFAVFTDRCGVAVAIDLLRALWTDPDPGCDVLSPRRRAMLIGARHKLADRTVRRACADAGLGSASSFTDVKQWLQEYELIATDRVSQPVGRPREHVQLPDAVQNASVFDLLKYAREQVLESSTQDSSDSLVRQ